MLILISLFCNFKSIYAYFYLLFYLNIRYFIYYLFIIRTKNCNNRRIAIERSIDALFSDSNVEPSNYDRRGVLASDTNIVGSGRLDYFSGLGTGSCPIFRDQAFSLGVRAFSVVFQKFSPLHKVAALLELGNKAKSGNRVRTLDQFEHLFTGIEKDILGRRNWLA